MFRIRESFPDESTVYLWFDGRLTEENLEASRMVIDKYMSAEKKIFVNLSNLVHVGWSGKRFLTEIKNKVVFKEEPEHLKTIV
jgi:hypothetical protein